MAEHTRQPFSWRPEFATGVAVIDDQHRVLISMLGHAENTLTDHSAIGEYRHIVQGLLNYAGYHFGTEETLMTEYGYRVAEASEAARHQGEHKAFARKVAAIQAALLAGQGISKDELLDFLTRWLADHILNTDKLFGAFICDCQTGSAKES